MFSKLAIDEIILLNLTLWSYLIWKLTVLMLSDGVALSSELDSTSDPEELSFESSNFFIRIFFELKNNSKSLIAFSLEHF